MFCEKLTEEQIRKVMNVISDDGALTILKPTSCMIISSEEKIAQVQAPIIFTEK